MDCLPLLFSFRDIIAGNDFFAQIVSEGRVLLVKEDEGDYWMYGVNPGGIAGGGSERADALREFKVRYLSVLFDIASEAPSYDHFKGRVEAFFNQTSEETEADWMTALNAVRSGAIAKDQGLQVWAADTKPIRVEVVKLDRARPTANAFDDYAEAA